MDPGVRKGWEKGKAALGMGPREEQGMREGEPGELGLAGVCFGSPQTEFAKQKQRI